MKRVTVLLADDHTIVREGIRKLLELDPGIEVIGEAKDGREAIALAKKLRPEVVLMDIAMPRLNGLEATRQVLKEVPTVKVLILSAHNDGAYIANAAKCGAVGFLLKQTSAQDLCRAIREVQTGKTFFGSFFAERLGRHELQTSPRAGQLKKKIAKLTPRELEVLQLVAEGKNQHQDRREASRAFFGEARPARHRRVDAVRHRGRCHRKQRASDHRLARWVVLIVRDLRQSRRLAEVSRSKRLLLVELVSGC